VLSGTIIALAGLLGVIATAVGGYLVARHKESGTIDTTEADTLWQQSNALLDRYQADLASTRAEVVVLKSEVLTLTQRVRDLESLAAEVARKLVNDAAVRLAINAAEVLAQPATGTPADNKARAEAVDVARKLAAKVVAEGEVES